jgi:hypothetical protein
VRDLHQNGFIIGVEFAVQLVGKLDEANVIDC